MKEVRIKREGLMGGGRGRRELEGQGARRGGGGERALMGQGEPYNTWA